MADKTPAQRRAAALQRIRAFEYAHDCYLFRGAGDPDERPRIEARYAAARERLIQHLMRAD